MNVNQSIYPISKRRYELALKSILCLKRGVGATTQRSNTIINTVVAETQMTIPNQHSLFEFWSLLRNKYPEITSMLYNYCLLFQHTAVGQHLRNTHSKSKQRSILNPEADMRVQLLSPDFQKLSLKSMHIHLFTYMTSLMERVKGITVCTTLIF